MARNVQVARNKSIPSLPPRLAALAGAVGTVRHPGQPERHHLQIGWAMSALEKAEAATLLASLTSALDPTASFDDQPGPMAKAALLTKLIRGLAGAAEMSDVVAAAKIEMYADAIEDLPAWSIDVAIKRWGKGSCPAEIEERPKYAFPPAPATLRALACLELDAPRRDARKLEGLIAAVPLERALDPEPMPKQFGVGPVLRRM
jgi:hypothetical protein